MGIYPHLVLVLSLDDTSMKWPSPHEASSAFTWYTSVADPGEGPGGPWSPLFLNQKEARRAKKHFLETVPPPPPIIWRSGSATDTVFCLSVTCAMFNRTMFLRFRQVFCLCFLTSCCSRRRNDSSQLVTPAYLMISELAWSRAVKNRAQS